MELLEDLLYFWKKPKVPIIKLEQKVKHEELSWLVFDALGQSLNQAKGSYLSKVHLFPNQWRAVYTLNYLDGQVNNGGFYQFFKNSRGDFDRHLVEDLSMIAGSGFENVIESAFKKYAQSKRKLNKEIYKIEDEKYRSHPEKLPEIIGQYILAHPDLFHLR